MPAKSRSEENQLARLVAAVKRLSDEVQILRASVDELIEVVLWPDRSDHMHPPAVHVTSMPLDPTADDWQINRLKPEDLPATDSSDTTQRGKLFE